MGLRVSCWWGEQPETSWLHDILDFHRFLVKLVEIFEVIVLGRFVHDTVVAEATHLHPFLARIQVGGLDSLGGIIWWRVSLLEVLNAADFAKEVHDTRSCIVFIIINVKAVRKLGLRYIGVIDVELFTHAHSCCLCWAKGVPCEAGLWSTSCCLHHSTLKRRLLSSLGKGTSHSCLLAHFSINDLLANDELTVLQDILEVFLREEIALLQDWDSMLRVGTSWSTRPVLPNEAALVGVVNHSVLSSGQLLESVGVMHKLDLRGAVGC